jgi:hypothetical protein
MHQFDDPVTGHVARDHPATGRDAPEDQVVRRMTFSGTHPEVTFAFDRDTGRWEATYPAGKSGTQRIQSLELRDLLDRLEEHFRGGIGNNRGAAGE